MKTRSVPNNPQRKRFLVLRLEPRPSIAVGTYTKAGVLLPLGTGNERLLIQLHFLDTYAMEWDFPWMLAIKYNLPVNGDLTQVLVCGASLVLPSVAITAAHCIDR